MTIQALTLLRSLFALGLVAAPLASAVAGPTYQFRSYSPGVRPVDTSPTTTPRIGMKTTTGETLSLLGFPNTAVGSNSAPLSAVLVNTGSAALIFDSTPFEVSERFSLADHDCPAELQPEESCSISLVFSPAAAEQYAGTLTVHSNVAGGSSMLALSGEGTMAGVTDVVTNGSSTYVRKGDGTWYASGFNAFGQLGLGDTSNRSIFTRVPDLAGVTKMVVGSMHAFAKRADGTWVAAGYNASGQLGLGDVTERKTFTAVPGLVGATEVVSGTQSTYAKFDGGVWKAAGFNTHGSLGLNDTSNRTSLTVVSGLANAIKLVAGNTHVFAQFADGTWKGAGHNGYGQLGLGDTLNRTQFTVIAGLQSATEVVAGGHTSFAKFESGSWSVTGLNNFGQLALGSTSNRLSFTAASALTGAAHIVASSNAATYVGFANGTWASVGTNASGQLGRGGSNTVLTEVPALYGATRVVFDDTVFAKRSDGSWVMVGDNTYGQMGLGDTANRSTFTNVPTP